MTSQWYYFTASQGLTATSSPPLQSRPLAQATQWIVPQRLEALHRSFSAWGFANRSPGIVSPERIWLTETGLVAFHFKHREQPAQQSAVGGYAGIAAWLVLLSKYTDLSAVLRSADAVWSTNELAGALAFTTPALLPVGVLRVAPANWEAVAAALAARVSTNGRDRTERLHSTAAG